MSTDKEVNTAFQKMLKADEEVITFTDSEGNVGQRIQKREYQKKVDEKGTVEKVQFTLDKDSLNKSLMSEMDKMRGKLEQSKRDLASLQDTKKGGGMVQLNEPKSNKKWVYDSYEKALQDLYFKAHRLNDLEAQDKLNQLWRLAEKKLYQITDYGKEPFPKFNITGCPICGFPRKRVEGELSNKCENCGFTYEKKGLDFTQSGDNERRRKFGLAW